MITCIGVDLDRRLRLARGHGALARLGIACRSGRLRGLSFDPVVVAAVLKVCDLLPLYVCM